MALLKPGDTFMGMDLAAGGHLTHGSPANQSGKWFRPVAYTVRAAGPADRLRRPGGDRRERERPKLIIAGGSAYSRPIDFARFRAIADEVGRLSDGGHGPLRRPGRRRASIRARSRTPTSCTTTTHKTLRGPRGGMILTNDEGDRQEDQLGGLPGPAGRPAEHVIAAKAVAFGEALRPEFKALRPGGGRQRPRAGRQPGRRRGVRHRLRRHRQPPDAGGPAAPKGVTGKARRARAGARAASPATRTASPSTPRRRTVTSGVRLGTPAGTTRGFGPAEFRRVGELIGEVLDGAGRTASDDCGGRGGGAGARCWS